MRPALPPSAVRSRDGIRQVAKWLRSQPLPLHTASHRTINESWSEQPT
jgi:hypothetical protein